MDSSRERDQSIERLLRQSLPATPRGGVTDSCLDAETLAAWVDGGLSGPALEMAQTHVADCVRCQSLVGAMARASGVLAQPEPERSRRPWLAWLVPLTAAALAVAVWIAVPRDLGTPATPAVKIEQQAAGTKAPEPAPLADRRQSNVSSDEKTKTARQDTSNAAGPQAPAARELRKEATPLEADATQRDALSSPAAAPPAALPAAEAPAPARAAASAQVFEGAKSANVLDQACAALPTDSAAQLTASAAPSTTVCWAVGRGGVVMLTTDGRIWQRVAFPEMTDLSAVRATDARTASVTTADGRMFSTSDGGRTWQRR